MANVYCYKGYCDDSREEGKLAASDKFLIIGGYVLVLAALIGITLYGVSQGIYVDPVLLP
ncbi:hypothetical protein [Sporomusa aerivorans]|uniref:hypothetical protein n=1 Tax=Sporomusa aerivorans TaxID=204936 RepID=UPI00352A950C